MMRTRRPGGSLLLSLAIHGVVAVLLLNIVFHYDFSGLRVERQPAAPVERVTYFGVAPGGGALGGSGIDQPAQAKEPMRGLVAPSLVPTVVPSARPAGGTPGGVMGGTGVGGGIGPTTGIVPADADPRLSADARQFFPVPKSQAQRTDSAIHALIFAYNDSVAKAAAAAGRDPGDWTFEKGGGKWGVDGNKIYLGKFAIPSAVLAALPLRIQANPGEKLNDRLVGTHRGEVLEHAAAAYHDMEFKDAVKRIRERKNQERKERLADQGKAPPGTSQ